MTPEMKSFQLQLQLVLLNPVPALLSPAQQQELILALTELLLTAAEGTRPSSTSGGTDEPQTHP
jgi:hypothetical protein